MNGINRQLETSVIASQIHTFNGNNAASYRLWMKHLRRAALERQPHDDLCMRKLVSRTVKDSASDFWTEIEELKIQILRGLRFRPHLENVFSNYVDAQIALQKVTKLKQERKQTLHSFAQKIIETAREAYSEEDYASQIVTTQIRDIFIDILCHKTSQLLISENVADLPRALYRTIRQELLQQTYQLREVDTIDDQRRNVEKMKVDALDFELENNEEPPTTQK